MTPSPQKQSLGQFLLSSPAVKKWSPLPFDLPEGIREMASKAFAFTHSPNLPGARLLMTADELRDFLKTCHYPAVLKTCFGLAGRGKWILNQASDLKAEVFEEFKKGDGIIGEPWVDRDFDFSTQWIIGDEIQFLGATCLINTPDGHYNKTLLNRPIPRLEEHLEIAKYPLKMIQERGYRGNVGIDAFIYEGKLHPICEINLRKTMGWLALTLNRNICYESGEEGPLPRYLNVGKKISFHKQLKLL